MTLNINIISLLILSAEEVNLTLSYSAKGDMYEKVECYYSSVTEEKVSGSNCSFIKERIMTLNNYDIKTFRIFLSAGGVSLILSYFAKGDMYEKVECYYSSVTEKKVSGSNCYSQT